MITIGNDGALQVNGGDVVKELLLDTVKATLATADYDVIQLRGDMQVPYGTIFEVMDMLATNGLAKIAILGDGRNAAGSAPSQSSPNPAAASVVAQPVAAVGVSVSRGTK